MSRSWMYGDRRELAFQKGVAEFCKAALEHQTVVNEPTIFCPCRDCCNVKGSMLNLKEDEVVWVTSVDVNELLRGACINVSVIQVYIRYLVELQATLQGEYIAFLCPHKVSGVECKRSFLDVVGYVKQAFISELKKEHQAHLILVPYNEDNHWIVMAIDLAAGVLYQFDPLAQQPPRQLSCDNVFNLGYRSYKSRIKGGSKKVDLDVVRVQCVQQTSGLECGYYVMKYMHEIVNKSSECRGDVKQIMESSELEIFSSCGES